MNKKETIIFFLKEYKFAEEYFGNIIRKILNKYNVIVLHTSNLEKSKKSSNSLFESFDISYWSSLKVRNFLLDIQPSQMIISNIRSLLDINMIIICNEICVNLLFIEHGLTLSKINRFKKTNKVHSLIKYSVYFSNFLINCLVSSNKSKVINNVYSSLVNSNYKKLEINKALLYSSRSYEILNNHLDLSNTNVLYSGYPIVESKNDFEKLKGIIKKKQIVLIHQPLIKDNFSSLSIENEIILFNEMNSISNKLGYVFVLKLHPRSNVEYYSENFRGKVISRERDIEKLIAESNIVIGFFSTALLTALKLKKSLLIFSQKKILTAEIEVFKTDNNSFNSVSQFEKLLLNLNKNEIELNQIDVNLFSGIINTHEDRFEKLISLFTV